MDSMADATPATNADAIADARDEGQRVAELEKQHLPLQQGATQYIISQRHEFHLVCKISRMYPAIQPVHCCIVN